MLVAASPQRAEPTSAHRARRRGLALHLCLLAAVLVAFVALSQPGNGYSSDEGASMAQARLLVEHGSWHYEYPLSWLDDARSASPFVRGDAGSNGLAPYAKHPLYPVLLSLAGGGTWGAMLLSVAGTVLAALTAALLARRFTDDPLAPVLALWATGVATPLLFDSALALAHSLAAAAVGVMVLLALRSLASGSRQWPALLGAAAAGLVASMLRTEAVLVVAVVAVVAVPVLRTRWSVVVAAALGAAGLVAVLVDRAAVRAIVGTPLVTPANTVTSGLQGRWDGFYVTWLSSSYQPRTSGGTGLWVALAVVAVGGVLLRRGRIGQVSYAAATVLATVLYLGRVLSDAPGAVPGLLLTVPVLWAMAWFVSRRGRNREWVVAALACGGGALAVLLTQYSIGGGVEWGGRYFALLLPVAVPVVVAGALPRLRATLTDRRLRLVVCSSAVVVTALVGTLALSTLRQSHERTADLAAHIAAVATDPRGGEPGSRPVVVTSNRLLPQILHPELDRYRWVAADEADIAGYMAQLADADVPQVVLVAPGAEPMGAALDGWTIRSVDLSSAYDIVVLDRKAS